jgi:hypothetical protein
MTKFWMTTMVAIMALGLTTGCPDDGDDCASDPSLCDGGDTASDVGADPDTIEEDADPDGGSDTVCPTCSVAGDWAIYYENDDSPSTVRLFQEGNHITGYNLRIGTYDGTITDGHVFIRWTWGSEDHWMDLTGEIISYARMEGTYVAWDPPGEVHSWYAERLTE